MLNLLSYIHPVRTYLPCTGVGRHINRILTGLGQMESVDVELLVSQQWLKEDSQLDQLCPIRSLPTHAFPMAENMAERSWKLFGFPRMDSYIPDDIDWLYAPVETYFPVSKCPVAVTIHDIQAFESDLPWSQGFHHRSFRYKWAWWIHRALSHSRVVLTVSEFSKQRMVQLLNADPNKIVVIGNGVEDSFFEVGNQLPAEPVPCRQNPYVLMVGGLRQKKGGDHFLSIANKLAKRGSDIKILIAGKSDPDYIEAAKACSNIELLGIVPDEALPNLMRNSLALLFLSLYEGFGIPPLEAMAAGVPAIVANRASLPEVVGDAGIVVEPDSHDEIIDIMTNLQVDESLRQQYIAKGRQHVKHYTWQRCVDKLITTFEEFS